MMIHPRTDVNYNSPCQREETDGATSPSATAILHHSSIKAEIISSAAVRFIPIHFTWQTIGHFFISDSVGWDDRRQASSSREITVES